MTTYFYQGEKIAAPLTIVSNEPVFTADTISLKQQRVLQGSAQRWELSFNVVATDPAAFFRQNVRQSNGTVTMIMPQVQFGVTETGTLLTSQTRVAGSAFVTLDGGTDDLTIPAGRFVKFSGHDKIYMTTQDEVANALGGYTFNVFPDLVDDLADNEELHYLDGDEDLILTAYRDTSSLNGIRFTDGVITDSGSILLTEAL